jgi:hypothetical protein
MRVSVRVEAVNLTCQQYWCPDTKQNDNQYYNTHQNELKNDTYQNTFYCYLMSVVMVNALILSVMVPNIRPTY